MPATAQIREYHGSGGGTPSSDIIGTTVRYKLADDDTTNTSNPMTLPGSGENLSWTKYTKVNWTTTPAGSISNLRYFVSSVPSGIHHYSWTDATYSQPATGDTAGIAGFTDNPTNKANNNESVRTSGSPLVVNAGTVLSNPSTGEGTQDFVASQLGILSTYAGGAGASSAISIVYRYSES